uniref:Uncharacterized protein n=1 Tax=Panagrolaimus superbus TaxID=310955 RepID=A0A914Y4N2_9BILA
MPKLHQVNASKVLFQYVDIPFNDFLFLASNAEKFSLFCTVVKYPDGSVVPLEKLVDVLPKLKSVELYNNCLSCISTETVKELLKAPNFKRIDNIRFLGLPDTFDIDTFFIFIKKNKHVKISLSFCHEISDAYKNCIGKIFDEIIAEKTHEYLMPYIDCQRLDYMKNHILREKYYAVNRLSKNIDFV